jgi:hypothetical protein
LGDSLPRWGTCHPQPAAGDGTFSSRYIGSLDLSRSRLLLATCAHLQYMLKSLDGMNEQDFEHQALYKNTTDGLFYFADWHASADSPPPPRYDLPGLGPDRTMNNPGRLGYHSVIVCSGWHLDLSIFASSAIPTLAHHDKFAALNYRYESTNVSNMFFIGPCTRFRFLNVSLLGVIATPCSVQERLAIHVIFDKLLVGSSMGLGMRSVRSTGFLKMKRRGGRSNTLWRQTGRANAGVGISLQRHLRRPLSSMHRRTRQNMKFGRGGM